MDRRLRQSLTMQEPLAINDVLLQVCPRSKPRPHRTVRPSWQRHDGVGVAQSLSFGAELDESRMQLQTRYAELIKAEALRGDSSR